MASIGEQIRTARKSREMTQDELASALNVTRTAVSKWENDSRIPDAESLLRISDALNYHFTTEDSAENPSCQEVELTASQKMEPKGTPTAETVGAAAPSDPQTIPEPNGSLSARTRNVILICAAAAVMLILALVAILLLTHPAPQPQQATTYTDNGGAVYNVDDYKVLAADEPGKAYLDIAPVLTVENLSTGQHFFYNFKLTEKNGIGFHIDRLEHVCFFYSGHVTVDNLTDADLLDFGLNPDLPPYGTMELEFGINGKTTDTGEPNAISAGLKVIGTDTNGEQLVFTSFLTFPQD